jgi:hypothetical protein
VAIVTTPGHGSMRSATISPKLVRVEFQAKDSHDHRMLEVLIVVVRALALALRGHRELVLENLALRQQLAVVHRTTRCRLRSTARRSAAHCDR